MAGEALSGPKDSSSLITSETPWKIWWILDSSKRSNFDQRQCRTLEWIVCSQVWLSQIIVAE